MAKENIPIPRLMLNPVKYEDNPSVIKESEAKIEGYLRYLYIK